MRVLIAVLLSCFCVNAYSATVQEKIFILRDSLETSQGEKFPYMSFNSTRNFTQKNARLELNVNDELDLWVVNLDSVEHVFNIKGFSINQSIPANDSIHYVNTFTSAGAYIYYCAQDFPKYSYLGLSGMLVVKDHNFSSFYWNIKDHSKIWNEDVSNHIDVDWGTYDPKFFTVNGNSHPNINADSEARITGSVGDTIIIYFVNTGSSIHPLHFHGYHVKILSSSKFPNHVGWEKDSQGIYPFESVVVELVPHQPGEYPIHDHNLIATTGGNVYPFGMLSTILIQP